jgi:hypothetical protein
MRCARTLRRTFTLTAIRTLEQVNNFGTARVCRG